MEVDVSPEHRDREAQEVVALCSTSDKLLGAVIGAPIVDGSVEDFKAYVGKWSRHSAVKGVRQVLHPQPHRTCLRPDIVEKARIAGTLNLVFELCMRADDLDAASELAAQCPQTTFVLDHCGGHHQLTGGGTEAAASMRAAWEAGIVALSKLPNVYCKLSGLMGAQGGSPDDGSGRGSGVAGWSAALQAPTVRFCVERFARNRLLFGGDWPICTLSAPLTEWCACCEAVLRGAGWSGVEKARLAKNAEECYRL